MSSILVFGSNLAGRHGAGSALLAAREYGAIRGQGWGRQGDSFAIPTKDHHLRTLPLALIEHGCRAFVRYARLNPSERFKLVAVGCGLAGYKPAQIAPFFDYSPPNVQLPLEFIY